MSARERRARGLARRPARILHLPWNTANHPYGLSRGERALGFESDVLVLARHPFEYGADIELNPPGEGTGRARKAAVALGALRHYDVFHFSFGRTLLQRRVGQRLVTEIPLLKRLGKVVLATFLGDDARPPSHNPWGPQDPEYLESQRLYQPLRRELMLRHAERTFYVNPDLRRWLPGARFCPYASIDPLAIDPASPREGDEIVVAHAPSHRGIKGTEQVIAAVDSLRAEGVGVRLELVEGMPHREALHRFARAHIAVDQLNLGWYGTFAVEMMALGRPVLCRIAEDEPEDNPFGEELPIVRTSAGTLRTDLRALCEDADRRRGLGEAGRRFVERHHDPRSVARGTLEGLMPIPADGAE